MRDISGADFDENTAPDNAAKHLQVSKRMSSAS